MGRALIDISLAAADVFAAADEALGEPISGLTFDGPEEDLNRAFSAAYLDWAPAAIARQVDFGDCGPDLNLRLISWTPEPPRSGVEVS